MSNVHRKSGKAFIVLLATALMGGCSQQKEIIPPAIVNFAMPQNSGRCTLVIQPMHDFLAEYSYHLIVRPTKGPDSEFDLEMQTGGQPEMQFFFYPKSKIGGPFLQILHPNSSIACADLINIRTGVRDEKSEFSKAYDERLKALMIVKATYLGTISKQLNFVEAK